LVGLCCTLFIEISQLPLYQRRTDIDDVLLNTIGVFIGALVYFEARAVYEFIKEDRKDSKMIAEN
jgi:glycopeptide antibiotics resistance protein